VKGGDTLVRRAPQSRQSEPIAQALKIELTPPSSHSPSSAKKQKSLQTFAALGGVSGDGGVCGGERGSGG